MYRILKPLRNREGILYPGAFSDLNWLDSKAIEKLTGRRAISEVAPPPLSVLPGWQRRSTRLRKLNILNAAQFLVCNEEKIGKALNVKGTTIMRWKEEVRVWLQPVYKSR